MNIRKWAGAVAAVAAAFFMAACGGGGGGSSGTPTPPPAPPPPPPVPAPYDLTPSTAQASFITGYPTRISMTARKTAAVTGVVYINVTANAAVIASPITVSQNNDGTYSLAATPLGGLAAGRYTGDFTVNVCSDVNCNSPLPVHPSRFPTTLR